MHNNGYYTEQNQKAEFYGGAIAGGCAFILFGGLILFVIASFIFCGDGC